MTKQEIRSKYLKLRLSLTADECARFSKEICNSFFLSIDLSLVKTLHTFLPIISKNEPDTWLIIERIKKDFPHIRVSIPRVENERMVNFYLEEDTQLIKNQWGILEPRFGDETPNEDIDLVIVPLLAFDSAGGRVGYGKGFYDRFLHGCKTDCEKIGISFFEVMAQKIPNDQYDIPLNSVITPTRIFKF